MQRRSALFWSSGVVILLLWTAGVDAKSKPDWVDGASVQYPDASYVVGVGFGDTRQGAENSAYAALSRVFRAQIQSTTREQEALRQTEKGKKAEIDRMINIQNQTEVSSNKILEEVRIAERWEDPVSKANYALAVLDRVKAASNLRQKSMAAEMEAKEWSERAEKSADPLEQARDLHKAILAARRNEGYEADLGVIQPTATAGGLPLVHTSELNGRLTALLAEHFRVGVHLSGPHADAVRDAVLAGLHERGFSSGDQEDITISGEVAFDEADLKDPRWRYVRWTAHLTLTQKETGKIFGSFARSGREGQLSSSEADRKALVAVQTEMTQAAGGTLMKFIFGE